MCVCFLHINACRSPAIRICYMHIHACMRIYMRLYRVISIDGTVYGDFVHECYFAFDECIHQKYYENFAFFGVLCAFSHKCIDISRNNGFSSFFWLFALLAFSISLCTCISVCVCFVCVSLFFWDILFLF